MQLIKFQSIIDDLFLGLKIDNSKIIKINIFENYDEGAKTKIENETKSVFEFKKLKVRVKRRVIYKLEPLFYDDFDIDFCFTIPKNQENLLKSFINAMASSQKKEGFEGFLEAFKAKNSNYFNHNLVYATTYGLGYYCLFFNQNHFDNINKQISQFLQENNIVFKNEFSGAFWVYRFKFKSLKKNNINLLNNLIIQF